MLFEANGIMIRQGNKYSNDIISNSIVFVIEY